MPTDHYGLNNIASAVALLRRKAPPGATTVLVGPPLIYGDERVCVFLCVGKPGRPSVVISLDFGRHGPDPSDDPLCQVVDTVLHARMSGSVTLRKARAQRNELVVALRRQFDTVEPTEFDEKGGDLALAERNAELFPSPESRQLLENVRREDLSV